jgi:ribA/ribD-fused uncharacterized protein
MTPEITRFSGEHRFLSNFYDAPTWYDGVLYPTSEHAFQAAKSTNPKARKHILKQPTPGAAKRAGRMVELREDWEDVKNRVMYEVCLAKFLREPLRSRLLDTGDAELIEGNYWHDTYWGVCTCEDCPEGRNELGKILMVVRKDLRNPEYMESILQGEWIKLAGGADGTGEGRPSTHH